MKKIAIIASGAALMMGMVSSCGNGASSDKPSSFEDSLSQSIGTFSGSQLASQYNALDSAQRVKFDKKQMLAGIKEMIMADSTKQSYVTGLNIGLQLWGQINGMEQSGIKINRQALYAAYEKAFMSDSVADMNELYLNNQKLMSQAQQIMAAEMEKKEKAAEEAKAAEPANKKTIEDGKAYVAKEKAADPAIKTTESGLSYKVISEGEGQPITDKDLVQVKYTGRHINGEVFDSSDKHDGPAVFSPRGVVPGFGEALKMMKKGAHYVIYIPGDLAYGANGTPDGSIKPFETLVFDIEVEDVNPAQQGR